MSISIAAWSQESGVVTLYGRITDSVTSAPLYFASVNLSGTNISNVSNSEGCFSLKVPEGTPAEAIVTVNHLGYRSRSIFVSAFDACTPEDPLEIRMAATPLQLDPATVKSIDAELLFRAAYHKVRDNYPADHVGMTAFYREIIRKGSSKYLALNEAVIDIDKAPYSGFASDKVGIYKGRGSTNYDSSDTLFVKMQGGIHTAMELDLVKNPFAGASLMDAPLVYDFFMDGVSAYDNHNFYAVGFRPKPEIGDILYKGKVYIETESLAIGRVEFEVDLAGREEEAAKLFVIKHPAGMVYYAEKAQYVVSYRLSDGKWYYDYCRVDLDFASRRRISPFRTRFSVTSEMAVTDHKAGGIAIEPSSRVRFKDILSEKVADFEDRNFWEDYNIIEPEQSIDAIIKKIVRQLSRRQQ